MKRHEFFKGRKDMKRHIFKCLSMSFCKRSVHRQGREKVRESIPNMYVCTYVCV
jgi:hypothetical protein